MSGRFLIIGTPIGNLADLSPRAVDALKSCDLLLCEDTRHSQKILTHFGISISAVESFHEHNEDEKIDSVVERVRNGAIVGLVSDAGMPLLSDPGFKLIRRLRAEAIEIVPIPGPFAAALALVASGIAPLPFAFFGFPPRRQGERVDFYRRLAGLSLTTIVYESPQRLVESLIDARDALGEVEVAIARELTKIHEEVVSGPISDVIRILQARESIRGEVTIVFAAKSAPEAAIASTAEMREEFTKLRNEGMRRNDAVRLLADRHGIARSELYRLLLEE